MYYYIVIIIMFIIIRFIIIIITYVGEAAGAAGLPGAVRAGQRRRGRGTLRNAYLLAGSLTCTTVRDPSAASPGRASHLRHVVRTARRKTQKSLTP